MSLKIVLVDDERATLKWLEHIIAELDRGYKVVASFVSAQRALEYCMGHPCDVLITDIRMPQLDGLELLGALNSLGKQVYTIILSAHSEFEYAKRAMNLKASEYLLKAEVTADQIAAALDNASALQSSEHKRSPASLLHFDNDLIQFLQGAKEGYDAFSESFSPSEGKKEVFAAIVYVAEGVDLLRVAEVNKTFLQQNRLPFIYTQYDGRTLVYVLRAARTTETFLEWSQTLSAFSSPTFHLITAEAVTDLQGLAKTFSQAMETLKVMIFHRLWGWHSPHSRQEELRTLAIKRLETLDADLRDHVQAERFGRIWSSIEAMFQVMRKYQMSPSFVEQTIQRVLLELSNSTAQNRVIVNLEDHPDIDSFMAHIQEMVSSIVTLLEEAANLGSFSLPVRQMIQYGERHLAKRITLTQVAEAASLNKNYASWLFSKEVGKPFSAWLMEKRMERAQELLREGELRIGEIAYQVGFADAAYFSKQFQRLYGLSPTDYRKEHYRL
jgi:two-component system response regulator YesN